MVECQLPKLNVAGSIPVPRLDDEWSGKKKIFYLVVQIFMLGFLGCATITMAPPETPVDLSEGFYHQVQAQETLWSIAKAYGLSVQEIVRANNIPNVALIEIGQLILIPRTKDVLESENRQDFFIDNAFQWPIRGTVLSYFKESRSTWINNGISIQAKYGQEIFPARRGEIVFSDFLPGYGLTLIIDHKDDYQSVYAFNAEILVSTGDVVDKEMLIAKAGGRGSSSFLHFEIRHKSQPQNPLYFLP